MRQGFTAPSSDGIHTLAGVVYLPQGTPKGFFHIVHGMTEHIGRYQPILEALASQGYIAFGYDNLGHGCTARNPGELGYIAPKNGWDLLCRDVKGFSDAVRKAYDPERRLPYYLMGHSMGSFITRVAVERYVKPDKYIIMGTGGSNPAADAGLAMIAVIKTLKGDHHISPLIRKLAFGHYNDRFGGGTAEDPAPWLSKDLAARQAHYRDPFCAFQFTVSAMGDLIRLTKEANRPGWYQNLPKDFPILLLSGDGDPVGDYGKGVIQVYERLKASGHTASCILYPNARHEVLNDDTYEQVKADILAFLEA